MEDILEKIEQNGLEIVADEEKEQFLNNFIGRFFLG